MNVHKMTIGIQGKDVEVSSIHVEKTAVILMNGFLKQAYIHDEWFVDIDNPVSFIETLKEVSPRPDIFTFIQRLPLGKSQHPYYWETESWAVLPVTTFDHWWTNQINSKTRNLVRKAEKKDVILKRSEFDDAFIHGMVEIFNETPVRQGRPFWHYGKDFETVKREFSRYLFRESLIGAFYKDELIGFIMLADAGGFSMLAQIISKVEHRDKSTNNALLAETIRLCEENSVPFLVYAYWEERTLGAFKRHNGFERFDLPRYYVPLTMKGKLALKLKLHHGVKNIIPDNIKERVRDVRNRYYNKK